MPRVAIFDGYPYQRGGAHIVAEEIARAGRDSGRWDATVVLPDDAAVAEWLRTRGTTVRITRLPHPLLQFARSWHRQLLLALCALPIAWWRLSRTFRQFDIVHSHDLRGLVLAGPAAALARRRLIVHLHDSNLSGRMWRLVARGPLRWTRVAVVVPSRRASVIWAGKWSARLVELPNPVEAHERTPESADATVVTLARLHPNKGLTHLIAAAELLAARGIQARVLIAGGVATGHEKYAEDLRALAAATGQVTMLDEVSDPVSVLAGAWVYVQPSEFEAFGLGALEAASFGLPVVASNVGGLPDIVDHDVTGYLVPAGDAVSLADAIGSLLASSETRERFGRAGLERVRHEFTEERFADALAQLYRC